MEAKLKGLLTLVSILTLNCQLALSQDNLVHVHAKVEYIDSGLKSLTPIVGAVSIDSLGSSDFSSFHLVLIKDDNNCKYVVRIYDHFKIKIKVGQFYYFTLKILKTNYSNSLFSNVTYPICAGFVLREYYSKIYYIQDIRQCTKRVGRVR